MAKKTKITKTGNISEWYSYIIQQADMADYSPVGGCIVMLPYATKIWESIQGYHNINLKKRGVENANYPLLIPQSLLEKEQEHIDGFSAEVAWVTEGGSEKLSEKLAIRPTSETIMYHFFAKFIQSHADMPLKHNQWCSIIRWEQTLTKPFIRGKEFWWTETHTCHSTKKEAEGEVSDGLKDYVNMCENLLAIPVIPGRKPQHDKFPGADYTTAIEAMMPDGKSLQLGTSHLLGQHFSKMFNIEFQDKNEKKEFAYQTSYGFSTRLLGGLVLVHGDDDGLVLPPKVAPLPVAIIPMWKTETKDKIITKAKKIKELLEKQNIDVVLDLAEDKSPGYKFSRWEQKGVPLRIEIGENELNDNTVCCVRRNWKTRLNNNPDLNKKEIIATADIQKQIPKILEEIQKELLCDAKKELDKRYSVAKTRKDFDKVIKEANGYCEAGWCGDEKCDEQIKEETAARIVLIPDKPKEKHAKCIVCGKPAKESVLFSRKY
ncbi:MAG: proline--tRNA ligase [Candidatus Aenigmarchaeota archaeon]|nr:proline--tRNA ligase [Candidatus Aenigmarchaeota archaeon]